MPKTVQNHYSVGNTRISDIPPVGTGPFKDRTIVIELDADHFALKERKVAMSLTTLMNLYGSIRELRKDIGYNDEYFDDDSRRMLE